ncbi:MAG: two-component sensor histidine kinase, partial [Actinomycetota bacterium]|nr:two-component sensor histidine kinase [Actinomycetota bacterium]
MNETVELALLAAGTAAVVAAAGALVLRALRRRSLGTQVAAVAVVAVVGVGVGAWAGARAMFLSEHDLWALGVILVAAGVVTVVSALLLGRRVGAASEALVGVARRLGDADARADGPGPAA